MKNKLGRVLVVDDADDWREELIESLERGGYIVEGAATLAEAREKLSQKLFHLVLLDLMMDDGDNDQGGLGLLIELKKKQIGKSIKVVMVSIEGTMEAMRQAFKESIVDFFDKNQFDNHRLLEQLPHIFEEHVQINLALDISWGRGISLSQAVVGLSIGEETVQEGTPLHSQMMFELEDLLNRLFYKAKSIFINPLTPGYSGTSVLKVRPVYNEGAARSVIVKFGDLTKIEEEYMRFKRYAEPYIGGGFYTTTIDLRYTPRLGGITYSLVGVNNDQLEDFGAFYRRATVEQLKKLLQQLFETTCGAWYDNPGKQDRLVLSEEYPALLSFTWEELHQALSEQLKSVLGREQLIFSAINNRRKFTNPIIVAEGQSLTYLTYTTTTHGDFNQHNILVDNNLNTWLIDFQETGPSHILRDITALDTEIRCKMLRADEATLREFLVMEEALCSIDTFDQIDLLNTRFQTQNAALARTYELIIYLRGLARQLLPRRDEDMNEYYAALFYHALNTIRFQNLATVQREHALLSASLLADKLGLRR